MLKMCVTTRTVLHPLAYTCICMQYVLAFVCMYVCMYMYNVHIHMYTHMYTWVHVCMYACMYVCLYVCRYACLFPILYKQLEDLIASEVWPRIPRQLVNSLYTQGASIFSYGFGDHKFLCKRRYWISYTAIWHNTKGPLLTFSWRWTCTPMIEPWTQSFLSLQRDGKKCLHRRRKPIKMFADGARILIQFFSWHQDDVALR